MLTLSASIIMISNDVEKCDHSSNMLFCNLFANNECYFLSLLSRFRRLSSVIHPGHVKNRSLREKKISKRKKPLFDGCLIIVLLEWRPSWEREKIYRQKKPKTWIINISMAPNITAAHCQFFFWDLLLRIFHPFVCENCNFFFTNANSKMISPAHLRDHS